MRVVVLIVAFVIITKINWCQIKPNVSFGYSHLIGTPSTDGGFKELQFGTGVQFNELLFAQLNYRFMFYELNSSNDAFTTMKNGVISISGGFRFLRKKRFSPLITIDLGTPIHSNGNGAFMLGQAHMKEKYQEGAWRYNRGLFFGKLKALCDVQLQAFNLQFGVSFNQWYYSSSWLSPCYYSCNSLDYTVDKTGIGGAPNFGLEVGLMYTIPTGREKKE